VSTISLVWTLHPVTDDSTVEQDRQYAQFLNVIRALRDEIG